MRGLSFMPSSPIKRRGHQKRSEPATTADNNYKASPSPSPIASPIRRLFKNNSGTSAVSGNGSNNNGSNGSGSRSKDSQSTPKSDKSQDIVPAFDWHQELNFAMRAGGRWEPIRAQLHTLRQQLVTAHPPTSVVSSPINHIFNASTSSLGSFSIVSGFGGCASSAASVEQNSTESNGAYHAFTSSGYSAYPASTSSGHSDNDSHNDSHNGSHSHSHSNRSNTKKRHQQHHQQQHHNKSGFWLRLKGANKPNRNNRRDPHHFLLDRAGLLSIDSEGRTPLHLALTAKRCPRDILLQFIALDPRAVAIANSRGRYPLHFAVVHKHDMQIISELVEAYPDALSAHDCKLQSPLAYAIDAAMRESGRSHQHAPRTFWMPAAVGTPEYQWQEEQCEKWSMVHWLLLASATHPRTSLTLGNDGYNNKGSGGSPSHRPPSRKPMLVDALLYAAPPAVVSLLIAASVTLLSHENRATAFAGSTLYSCIARHYPLPILHSLASQCPKDVQAVQDETGMGLVSSQFISGCFQQQVKQQDGSDGPLDEREWILRDEFYDKVDETIAQGVLDEDDDAFCDWWKKIEFLLAFCAVGNEKTDPFRFPTSQLLFCALKNMDTPPQVVEMLLALYPQSIRLTDLETGAFPLYIVASRREYVPRKYELEAFRCPNILDIVLKYDEAASTRKFGWALPIHGAVAAGRNFSEIQPLVAPHPEVLLERDPSSGLYPFMQAAVPQNRRDLARWTSVARNMYSFAAWKEQTERLKAGAVIKVAEMENLKRLETIYELLRMQPGVVDKLARRDDEPAHLLDEYAVCGVSWHFCSWYYEKTDTGTWVPNVRNIQIFRSALKIISSDNSFKKRPDEFNEWWKEMKVKIVASYRSCGKNDWAIPLDNENFLLHLAVSNPDTPPHIVAVLMTMYPNAISLPLPDVPFLPLHIAARTLSYKPRRFEAYHFGSLDLLLSKFPQGAEIKAGDYFPLHLALHGRKTWDEIVTLVEANPNALLERDPESGLYPFQLSAVEKSSSARLRSWFQNAARNQFEEQEWDLLSSRERFREVRRCQKVHQEETLSCTFELLRKSSSLVASSHCHAARVHGESSCPPCSSEHESKKQGHYLQEIDENASECVGSDDDDDDDDSSSSRYDESCSNSSSDTATSTLLNIAAGHNEPREGTRSSLEQLLSTRSISKVNEDSGDLFECDASVISSMDIMSTLAATSHSHTFTRKQSIQTDYSRRSLPQGESRRRLLQKTGSLRQFLLETGSSKEVGSAEILRRDDNCRELFQRSGSLRELMRQGGSQRDLLQRAEAELQLSPDALPQHSSSSRRASPPLQTRSSSGHGNPSSWNGSPSALSSNGNNDGSPIGRHSSSRRGIPLGWNSDRQGLNGSDDFLQEISESPTSSDVEEESKSDESDEETPCQVEFAEESLTEENTGGNGSDAEYEDTWRHGNDKESDEDEMVTFLLRRKLRITSKQERDSIAAVQLRKRRQESISFENEEKVPVSPKKTITIGSASQKALRVSVHSTGSTGMRSSSHHSTSTTSTGYKSLDPEEKKKLSTETGMLWVGDYEKENKFRKKRNNLLGSMDESESENDLLHIAACDKRNHLLGSMEDDSESERLVVEIGDQCSNQSSEYSRDLSGSESTATSSESTDTLNLSPVKRVRVTIREKIVANCLADEGFVTPLASQKLLGRHLKATTTTVANVTMMPGIFDYLQQNFQLTPDNSVMSNTPSTLSYLQDTTSSSSSPGEKPEGQMYFDKASMKWERRLSKVKEDAEGSEGLTADDGESSFIPVAAGSVVVHDMYFCKEEWMWKKRQPKQVAKPPASTRRPKEDQVGDGDGDGDRFIHRSPRIGMPFVDFISREDIKRRNRSLTIKKHDESIGLEKGKLARTKDPFVMTPGDAVFRSTWKAVLDGETEHFRCLLCKKNAREVLMVPCRHLAICRLCSTKQPKLDCPLCNCPTSDRMMIC